MILFNNSSAFTFKIKVAAFLFLLSIPAFAQSVTIEGVVYDSLTRFPVQNASVALEVRESFTRTNPLGAFSLKEVPPGLYTLNVSALGYRTKAVPVDLTAGTDLTLHISLYAAPMEMEEVVIEGNNKDNIISSVDIDTRPVTNSQEVLKMVPGLFIAQHAGGGKAEQIFLRGFDIDHGTDISISVDGIPVNMTSHAHGQGYSDLHFVIPEVIGSVNFEKGSYNAAKGNFATAGYVDYQTKESVDKSMIKAEGGMFNTYRGVAMLDLIGDNSKHDAYVASEYLFSDGYFESPQNLNRFNGFGKYTYTPDPANKFTFTASAFGSRWDASGQIPERAVKEDIISPFGAIDDTEGGKTHRVNLQGRWQRELSSSTFTDHSLFYSYYDFNLYSNFTFFLTDSLSGDQIKQSESRNIFGYKGSVRHNTNFLGKYTTYKAGIDIRYDRIKDLELSRTYMRDSILEPVAFGDINELNVGLYAQQELYLNRSLRVSPGIRYDLFSFAYDDEIRDSYRQDFAGIFSPKLNFYYDINPHLQLYLFNGLGFHSNDTRLLTEMHSDILSRSYQSEAGTIFKPGRDILINASLWYLFLEQEMIYVGDEGIVEPAGRTRRVGLDLSYRHQITNWLAFDLDVNLAKPELLDASEGEKYVPLAPSITSEGGITLQTREKKLLGSLRYRYLGDRPANEDYSLTADGYFLVDAAIHYRINKFMLGLKVQNLFDAFWKEAQFETESRLRNELLPVSEIHYTPGTPFQAMIVASYSFR